MISSGNAASMERGGSQLAGQSLGSLQHGPPSLTERLEGQKVQLEQQLANVNAALRAIKSSPEIETAVNAIARVGHF